MPAGPLNSYRVAIVGALRCAARKSSRFSKTAISRPAIHPAGRKRHRRNADGSRGRADLHSRAPGRQLRTRPFCFLRRDATRRGTELAGCAESGRDGNRLDRCSRRHRRAMGQPRGFRRLTPSCRRAPSSSNGAPHSAVYSSPPAPGIIACTVWRRFSAHIIRAVLPCCCFLRFPSATFPASRNWKAKPPACCRSTNPRS